MDFRILGDLGVLIAAVRSLMFEIEYQKSDDWKERFEEEKEQLRLGGFND